MTANRKGRSSLPSRASSRPAPAKSSRPAPAKSSRPTSAKSSRPTSAKSSLPSRAPVRWSADDGEAWHDDWSLLPSPAEVDDDELVSELPEESVLDDDVEAAEGLEALDDEAAEEPVEEAAVVVKRARLEIPEDVADDEDDEKRGRRRSKTIARKQMLRERRRMLAQGTVPEIVDYDRPNRREECRDEKRPCLYVSCRYHLYLDVNPETGSIKLNFPDKEVWELEETCALDVAERGGITLEEVGEIMNLTRERIRQVEVSGLEKLKDGPARLHTFIDGRELELSQRPRKTGLPKKAAAAKSGLPKKSSLPRKSALPRKSGLPIVD
ncbi:hypothetical protein L6R52_34875 [Myxococcota bacterium]|nr:hypothetical protein [Myxococcota bacterium]